MTESFTKGLAAHGEAKQQLLYRLSTTQHTQYILTQYCFSVGPSSTTMAQHLNNFGSVTVSRICLEWSVCLEKKFSRSSNPVLHGSNWKKHVFYELSFSAACPHIVFVLRTKTNLLKARGGGCQSIKRSGKYLKSCWDSAWTMDHCVGGDPLHSDICCLPCLSSLQQEWRFVGCDDLMCSGIHQNQSISWCDQDRTK